MDAWDARQVPGAAPERKRLNGKAQPERYSVDCKAMPYEVRFTTVPVEQRQRVPAVPGKPYFRASTEKGVRMSGQAEEQR